MNSRALVAVVLCGLLTCWAIQPGFAAGGKNQGDTGQGETTTGSDAQGEAEQDRTGRADSPDELPDEFLEILLGE